MTALADDVAVAVARGIGAFIRATPAAELPPKLKRFKRFDRPKALVAQKDALLAVLDSDELTRTRILEWISDGRPALTKRELEILRLVSERLEGWEGRLAPKESATKPTERPEPNGKDYARMLEREKERTSKAKEDLRRARSEHQAALKSEAARAVELVSALEAARAETARLREALTAAETTATAAARAAERAERKRRLAIERATAKEQALRDELRAVRKELRQVTEAAARAQRERKAAATRSSKTTQSRPTGRRRRLRAPKGRLETDPETLEAWLDVEGVALLVDGYNVTKSKGGFGDVDLAQQRRRLTEGVGRLARRKKVTATIVFDGSEVPPGTSRRPRAPIAVEYSKPGEIADDHLVARLEEMDAVPVIVVTDDRELQHRAAALGATLAASAQLLALIR